MVMTFLYTFHVQTIIGFANLSAHRELRVKAK